MYFISCIKLTQIESKIDRVKIGTSHIKAGLFIGFVGL